jgi:hypothetical protein
MDALKLQRLFHHPLSSAAPDFVVPIFSFPYEAEEFMALLM